MEPRPLGWGGLAHGARLIAQAVMRLQHVGATWGRASHSESQWRVSASPHKALLARSSSLAGRRTSVLPSLPALRPSPGHVRRETEHGFHWVSSTRRVGNEVVVIELCCVLFWRMDSLEALEAHGHLSRTVTRRVSRCGIWGCCKVCGAKSLMA